MSREPCRTCRHYAPLAVADSGIPARDGRGNWYYHVGHCQPSRSVHSGRDNLPEWGFCEYWRARRRS